MPGRSTKKGHCPPSLAGFIRKVKIYIFHLIFYGVWVGNEIKQICEEVSEGREICGEYINK